MALYGKYRPQNFSDVVGQESIKTTLLHASAHKKISHASLFCGTRGTGKTTSARILAKALNCQNLLPSGDPCLKCEFCIAAEEGRMTDIIEIDAASNRGIDEIRDLREKVNFSPNFGKAKIYIIDEVHMLTKEAFNALLKTLEEPPEHAYFILATTEFHKVPETIRSRCQTFFFRKISRDDIVKRLEFICMKEEISANRKGLEIIADRANGGLRDAISLLEQSASYGEISEKNLQESLGMISEHIFGEFFTNLQQGESKKALSILDSLQDEGRNLEEFGKDFLEFLRKKFHIFLHSRDIKLPWILQVIDIFENALQKCRIFDIPALAFEIAIAKAMLLQKEFSESLISCNSSEEIIDDLIEEKHYIADIQKKEIQKFVETDPDYKKQKKIQEKNQEKKDNITPPWEDKKALKKEKEIKEEVKSIEKAEQKISPLDDFDMFPDAGEVSLPPQKEEKISEKTPEKEGELSPLSLSENVQKHWKDILSLLPKSIKTTLDKFGTFSGLQGNTIYIKISGESNKKLLSSQKNLEKIQEVFSNRLEKNITLTLIREEENPIFTPPTFPKNPENSPEIEISEMEDLLKF